MTVNIPAIETDNLATGLDPVKLYHTMLTARVTNELLKTRKTQGRFPFYIGCGGHESMAAVVAALNDDDWLALYYRDLAAWLQRTGDIYGPLREAYSRTTAPMTAGRNMPAHYSSRQFRILPSFSEVAGHCPFAGGFGFAVKWHQSQQIVLCSTGDGGAATNDFHALVRLSAIHRLPILAVVEDNNWAITTTGGMQWAGSLVEWARGSGVYAEEVDGSNVITTFAATQRLAAHIRSGNGPALLHLHLGLLDPHSSSTDIRSYRKKEILTEPEPTSDRVLDHVISVPQWRENIPRGPKRQMTMLAAINEALVELALRDPNFFVYGEDVGSPKGGVFGATASLVTQMPERAISSPLNEQIIIGVVAGTGIYDGKARCAEIQFVDYHQPAAQTIRLAARISYQTYGHWYTPLLIRTKSGSGGGGPISSGGAGGGAYGHSNAGEQWFTCIPGMITICPSTPFDAKGLLLEAARTQSPVTFLERGRLYRSEPPRDSGGTIIAEIAQYWQVPEGYYTLPIGKARRIRIGTGPSKLVIIAWGTMVLEACTAAMNSLHDHDGAIEVLDLRTLMPFDEDAIRAAVKEANRVMVVTEETDHTNFGRHIHSWIVQHCFYDLDCTPAFISAIAAPTAPYHPMEENAFYPSAQTIATTIETLLAE
jgi:2-oxoisovalerate dehydrogenase E1 component